MAMFGRPPAGPAQHVLITGAGGVLGRALALRFSAPGVTLSLCDIDGEALATTTRLSEAEGAAVNWAQVDIGNRFALERWIVHVDRQSAIDLVIANAGVSPGTELGDLAEEQGAALAMVQTNLAGTMNTIYAAVDLMAPRGRGHIVIVSSMSALNGFPRVPAYAATKAGVRIFGESLRFNLRERGIRLLIVFPGFFSSGMSATAKVKAPGALTAAAVAERIHAGVRKGRRRVAFPLPLAIASRLLSALPDWLGFALYKKFFSR